MRTARARLVVVETLERRALLNGDVATSPPRWAAQEAAATLDVQLDGVEANAITFLDADGTAGRVQLRGGGAATVRFAGLDLATAPSGRTVRLTGTGVFIDAVSITGTTDRSTLSFNARGGDGLLRVNGITADGPLKVLDAKPVVLTGASRVAGGVARVTVRSVENAQIDLGGSAGDAGTSARIGTAFASEIASGRPLRDLRVGSWQRAPENGVPHGSIRAPSIGRLSLNGEAVPDVATAGNLGSATVNVSLRGGAWAIGGDLGRINSRDDLGGLTSLTVAGSIDSIVAAGDFSANIAASSIGSVVVGRDMQSTVRLSQALDANTRSIDRLVVRGTARLFLYSADNVGSLVVGAFFSAGVFVGVHTDGIDFPTIVDFDGIDDFASAARVEEIRAKSFGDTTIAAPQLGRVDLGTIDLANRTTRPPIARFPFGIAADRIDSLRAEDSQGRQVRASALEESAKASAIVASAFPDPQEFELRVF